MSKKLINAAVDAVDDSLAGLVAACPGLRLLQGHRVVVRADVEQVVRAGMVRNCRSQVFFVVEIVVAVAIYALGVVC